MCDNQFAWWLQNRQKVNNVSDDALEFMKNDLIKYFGGIRSIIDKLFKHHTNLTINEHQKFFKFIDNKNKKYIESLEQNNKEIEVENDQKLDESTPAKLTLCDVNDQCLCNVFTFLSVTEHRNLQKCCINFNIIGTMRGSFISSQQMLQFGYIPHLTANIKRLNNLNKDNLNNDNQTDDSPEMMFYDFIHRLIYINNDLLQGRLLKQLCFNGHLPSIMQATMSNITVETIMDLIYNISFNDELCWLLVNDDALNVLINVLEVNKSGRLAICVLESLQNLINSHPSWISRLYKKGIPDILMKHIPKYSNERDWHWLHPSLILLSSFIPFIAQNQQIQGIIDILIEAMKILIKWIYDKKLLSSTVLHKIPAVIGRILYSVHCNQPEIDFTPLMVYISKLISSMKLSCFHTPETAYFDDTLYELVFNLFKCKWDHIDIVEKYFENVGFAERAIKHNEPKRVRIEPLIEVVLESKIDVQTKRKRLEKLHQIFKRDIYLVFQENVKIALVYIPISMDLYDAYWLLRGVSSIQYNHDEISTHSETLCTEEMVDCLKKIFENEQEEIINRDNWMTRSYLEYSDIISILSMIYNNCNDDMVRGKCHDLMLQIWSEDIFTYFGDHGLDIGNYENQTAFKNMVTTSIEFSKAVRKRFVMDNPWFVNRLLVLGADQLRFYIDTNDNKQQFVTYLDDIWRSVEALDETQNKIESKNYLINNNILEQYAMYLGHFKLGNVDDTEIENLLRSLNDFLESYSLKQEDNAHFITLKPILILLFNDYHHSGLKEEARKLLDKST